MHSSTDEKHCLGKQSEVFITDEAENQVCNISQVNGNSVPRTANTLGFYCCQIETLCLQNASIIWKYCIVFYFFVFKKKKILTTMQFKFIHLRVIYFLYSLSSPEGKFDERN